jgi:antitoxin component YwqK of YwqJK toxin-antitoxin module
MKNMIYIICLLIFTTSSFSSDNYVLYLENNKNIDLFNKQWKNSDEYEEYKILKYDKEYQKAYHLKTNYYKQQEIKLLKNIVNNLNINNKNDFINNIVNKLPFKYTILLNKIYFDIIKNFNVNNKKELFIQLYHFLFYTAQNNSWELEYFKKIECKSTIYLEKIFKIIPKIQGNNIQKELTLLSSNSDRKCMDIIKKRNKNKYKKSAIIKDKDGNDIKYTYYKNGNIKSKVPLINGKKNGYKYTYYDNGSLKIKVNYINDKREGKRVWYYKNGNIRVNDNYKNDKHHGIMKKYYESGQIKAEAEYILGKRVDKLIQYYENGHKKVEYGKNYTIFYYENGLKKKYITRKNKKRDGLYIEYKNNTKKQYYIKGQYKNGKKIGTWEYYSIFDNFIYKIITYKNDLKDGLYTRYNSIIKNYKQYTINYKNGKRDGILTEYDLNKNVTKKINYKNGKKDGKYLEYAYSKKLSKNIKVSEINYKNGKRDGKATWWYTNGKLKKESFYKNDKLNGTLTNYKNNGLKISEYIYKNDILKSTKKFQTYGIKGLVYLESKKINNNTLEYTEYNIRWKKTDKKIIYKKWKTVNGLKDGKLIIYNDNGTINYLEIYKKGILHNRKSYYYKSRNLWSETVLNPKTKLYTHKIFNKKGKISEKYSYKSDYNKKVGKYIRYSPDGKIIVEEIYDKNSKLISSKNYLKKDLENIVNKYKNNKSKGLAYYWLDLERQYGFDTKDAKKILDNLVSKVKSNITIQKSYTQYQAKDIMNTIGNIIKNEGIIYDTSHIDIFSKTLVNRAMDCDLVSMLYVTIGDRLNLPIYAVFYPGHMALKWKDNHTSFLWEATSHEETTLLEYKKWILYKWNATNGIKKYGYATELDEKEIFSHIFNLLSTTINDYESKNYFSQIAEKLNTSHLAISWSSDKNKLFKVENERIKIYGKNDYSSSYTLAYNFYMSTIDEKYKKVIKHLIHTYKYIPKEKFKIAAMDMLINAYKNLKQYENAISIYEELIEVDYSNRNMYNKEIKKLKKIINDIENKELHES